MKDYGDKGLLPAGLADGLPPGAAQESGVIERLMQVFASFGYDRVKPPLIEFEESLLSGPGAALAAQTFRLMDPVSQRMMGVRADITPQVARLTATRLKAAPRPLRLCYSGQVLRVRGSQLRPERQFAQAGAELVGAAGAAANAEVVLLAVEALTRLGVADLSVDLVLPTLVPAIAAGLGLDAETAAAVRHALDRKDAAELAQVAGSHGDLFGTLLQAAGPATAGIAKLTGLGLPDEPRAVCTELAELAARIAAVRPKLAVTIDPGEYRGFEYQSGISFSLFAKGVRGELGRGGHYTINGAEEATGFTLYLDSVMRALPVPEPDRKLYLGTEVAPSDAAKLRHKGWRTVQGLEPVVDTAVEARRLGCSHVLENGEVRPLEDI